jgi:hypothetical protein
MLACCDTCRPNVEARCVFRNTFRSENPKKKIHKPRNTNLVTSHSQTSLVSASKFIFFSHGVTVLVGQGVLIIEALRSLSPIPHSVGILSMSDQPDAETSTWQQTTLTSDIHTPTEFELPIPGSKRPHNSRLRPRGQLNWLQIHISLSISIHKVANLMFNEIYKITYLVQLNVLVDKLSLFIIRLR